MSLVTAKPPRFSLPLCFGLLAVAGCGQLVHVNGAPLGQATSPTSASQPREASGAAAGGGASASAWFDTLVASRPWGPLTYRYAKHDPTIPPAIMGSEPLRRPLVREFEDQRSAMKSALDESTLKTFRAACDSGQFRGLELDAERKGRLREIFKKDLDVPELANEAFSPDGWCGALAKDALVKNIGDRLRKSSDAMVTAFAEGLSKQVSASTDKELFVSVDMADVELFERLERDETQQAIAGWWSDAKLGAAPDVTERMKAAQAKRRASLDTAPNRSVAPFAPKFHDAVAEQKARDGFAATHAGAKWLRGGSEFADWQQNRNAFGKVLSRSRQVQGLYAIAGTSSCLVAVTVVTVPFDGKKFHDESASFRIFSQTSRVTTCK